MTVTLEITPEQEARLRATAARAGVTPDRFLVELLEERLDSGEPGARGLPALEAQLPERIGGGLAPATWKRYGDLKERRDAGVLTDEEHGELLDLVNEVETWNARRLEAVAELAALRKVRFPELVRELGLGH